MTQIVELKIADLIGKPFSDLGRGPDSYDCWGLVLEVSRRLGRKLPDYEDSFHHWQGAEIAKKCETHMSDFEKIPMDKAESGDIVLFNRITDCLHFGVAVDPLHVLHTSENTGAQMVRMDNVIMRRLIKGIYRCKK